MLRGYARVSTDAQSLEGQLEALKAAGCQRVYSEIGSGADSARKALARLMKEAAAGDTVVVTRLDRLARSNRGARYAGQSHMKLVPLAQHRRAAGLSGDRETIAIVVPVYNDWDSFAILAREDRTAPAMSRLSQPRRRARAHR